jgi:hypothetical protein
MNSKSLVRGLLAASSVSTLIVACTSSGTVATSNSGNDPTPPGTTPVASAPYSVCTPLESGSFTTTSSGAYTVPATTSCSPAGSPTSGAADTHCVGQTPQEVSGGDCSFDDAAAGSDLHVVHAALRPEDTEGGAGGDSGSSDSGPTSTAPDSGASSGADASASEEGGATPVAGPCGENGPDYGATMYGTEGDDDDCKYHVNYSVSPLCENNGTYFVVTANYLTRNGAALTGASTFAELCLSDTHPAPAIDSRPPSGSQQVVEGPPGTYTIGPVQFDAPGNWTVRFHFNEFCCDVADDSPHGHAAFHVTVP